MDRLLGQFCYMIGPIDRAADLGRQWRQDITPWLQERGVLVLDPTDKPINVGDETLEARAKLRRAKEAGDYDLLRWHMRSIRHVDLAMVDRAGFLIAFVDMDIVMTGTMEEIFWANRCKKPVCVVCKQGKVNAPDWLFGTLPHEMIFSSFDQLKVYLDAVDTLPVIDDFDRWLFFDQRKIYTPRVLDRLAALHQTASSVVA